MRAGLCTPAIPLLRRAIAEATIQMDAHVLLAECLLAQGDDRGARAEVLRGSADGPYGPVYHHVLLTIDSVGRSRAATQPGPQPGPQTGPQTGAHTDVDTAAHAGASMPTAAGGQSHAGQSPGGSGSRAR